MWHQWSSHGVQLHQTEPPNPEKSDTFVNFAKRSREVHRQDETRVPSRTLHHSPLTQYNDAFWEKIVQDPSDDSTGLGLSFDSPINTLSMEQPELVCNYEVARGTKRSSLCLDSLPTPSQLMGRKKRGRRLIGDTAERQVTAVTQHIGELRRKQNIVDQMKKEKWWGSTFSFSPETRCSPIAEELTEPEDPNPPGSPVSLRTPAHLRIGSCHHEAFNDFRSLLDLAPGGDPMMSFVVTGTADRGAQRDWDLDRPSHAEFWGFRSANEE